MDRIKFFHRKFITALAALCVLCMAENSYAIIIEKTAENGVAAKAMAMDQARRMSFENELGMLASPMDAQTIAAEISSDDLNSLIESTAIEDEKQDTTSYSADISVRFSKAALGKWLKAKGLVIEDPAATFFAGRVPVFLEPEGINDLGAIMRASRETGADLKITTIEGGRLSGYVRDSAHQAFLGAVRAAGIAVSY